MYSPFYKISNFSDLGTNVVGVWLVDGYIKREGGGLQMHHNIHERLITNSIRSSENIGWLSRSVIVDEGKKLLPDKLVSRWMVGRMIHTSNGET
jgi:hypothetical protein